MKPYKLFLFACLLTGVSAAAQEQLTLKESIGYGLKNSHSLNIYKNNKLIAEQKARESLSGYLPQVNINAGLDDNLILPVTIIPAGTFGPGTPEQKVSFGTQYASTQVIQVDQPIYNQAALTGLKARKPNLKLAELNEELNQQTIIYNVASSYFKILVAQKQIDLLKDNKARLEKSLEIAQIRAKEGVAKKIDVKQVQVNVNNIAAQLSIINNSLALAENTLKFHLGMQMTDSLILTDSSRWLNSNSLRQVASPAFDYKGTLDYQLQQTQLELLDINRQYVRDGKYPSLSFYGRYGANGFGQKLGDAYSKINDFATIGLKFSWNLFGGFRRDAQYRIANFDYLNAAENLRIKEEQQNLAFQNANLAYNRAQSTISINDANMEMANEVYNNVAFQHKEGVATLTDLLNAEASYRQAQNNYIQSLLDYYLAELELRRANGTLDEFYEQL